MAGLKTRGYVLNACSRNVRIRGQESRLAAVFRPGSPPNAKSMPSSGCTACEMLKVRPGTGGPITCPAPS